MNQKQNVTLVVLAAGMGSRYGGLKQMDAFGPHGETIIDYSLYDAHRAGFTRVVFIIREYFAEAFKEVFEPKLKGRMQAEYVFQELHHIPGSYDIPAERDRPWGTGHAIWVAHDVIDGPFGVINADDYYGPESYKTLYSFLTTERQPEEYGVVSYRLDKTLSEHGTVNRGVCERDAEGYLRLIEECKQIGRDGSGMITYPLEDGTRRILPGDTPVSMNMWGFYPSYFRYFESQFADFLKKEGQDLKSEFYIPTLVDHLIRTRERQTRVLYCDAEWFGVTYREDKPYVSERLSQLIAAGVYPEKLWN